MPIQDWTFVDSFAFHDFHGSWIYSLHHALNGGLLPDGYYAMAEQVTGDVGPDVITLQESNGHDRKPPGNTSGMNGSDSDVMTMAPPLVRFTAEAVPRKPKLKPRRLTIRHVNRDRIVAILEIVSRSNKATRNAVSDFVRKIVAAVNEGIHAVVIDPFPATKRDPEGLHALIWKEIGGSPIALPAEQPLRLSSYEASEPRRCYVEPLATGEVIPSMPLYIHADRYITLPLEETYQSAFRFVPAKYQSTLFTTPS
ncbi:MAG: DUF4058 family protein [Gemmataceae bacterium]